MIVWITYIMVNNTLVFVRQNGVSLEEATVVILNVATDQKEASVDVLNRLTSAVSDWASNSEIGRLEWKASSEDFNIGDLANINPDSLAPFLNQQGIHGIGFVNHDHSLISYDKVLVNLNDIDFAD